MTMKKQRIMTKADQYLAAYRAAAEADDAFQRECVRQFSEALAGDKRYRSDLHDTATKQAGIAKCLADNECSRALKAMRAAGDSIADSPADVPMNA